MITQCKGKDINLIPKNQINLKSQYIATMKYDGNYVQIQKKGDEVRFYTSGGKRFYVPEIANYLVKHNPDYDFVIETEYIAHTEGKLGSRVNCSTTSMRVDFQKGFSSKCTGHFKLFDMPVFTSVSKEEPSDPNKPLFTDSDVTENPYSSRMVDTLCLDLPKNITKAEVYLIDTLENYISMAKSLVNMGWEGLYLKDPFHIYIPGKRVNNAIKLKRRPTADLLCIGVEEGLGKYTGKLGALILQDNEGRIVRVGSGLSDFDRNKTQWWIGKIVEIEYEQIIDTYIQPTFVSYREDKSDV